MINKTFAAALVMCLMFATLAAAADMTEFRSRRYDVVTDLPAEQARQIAMHMDKVFDEYVRRLARAGFRAKSTDRMNLYLFDSAETYQSQLATKGINATGSGGMFFVRSGESGLATFVGGRPYNDMIATLQHEGFHQFAYLRIGSNLPIWANEGLAEYFGDALLVRGRFVMGQVDARRLATVRQSIEDETSYGFGELLNMSSRQWLANVNSRDKRAHLMYDQSWAIVHFLVHGQRERFQPAFMAYLQQIHKGKTSEQAFETAFGSTNYEPFEKAWLKYMEELDADPLTVAHQRVTFLASGLRRLDGDGVKVDSLEQLKEQLQRIDYWYSVSTHGYQRRMEARDDELFTAPTPTRRGRNVTLTVMPDPDSKLPPDVVVRGLQAEVRTEWKRDDDGQLTFEIVYQ